MNNLMDDERQVKIEGLRFDPSILGSVVKVFSCAYKCDNLRPWQILGEVKSSGTGFAFLGNKILTNAHLVDVLNSHTFVQVKKHNSEILYKAKIHKISHECDLAVLDVDNKEFWEGLNILEFTGDLPHLDEAVAVVAYPTGHETVKITACLVTNIDVVTYRHSDTDLLALEIDTNINGYSGGPVIMRDRVVGVVLQNFDPNNIGFAVPCFVIEHFLSSFSVEESVGCALFGSLGITYQNMLDPTLCKNFKMKPGMTGVLIRTISPLSWAHGHLQSHDVILSIDGSLIGNDGTVILQKESRLVGMLSKNRPNKRVNFNHLVSMRKVGDLVFIQILRDGKKHAFKITLTPVKPHAAVRQYYILPSYFTFGGFVFVPFTKACAIQMRKLCECELHDVDKMDVEHEVIISQILTDEVNHYYKNFQSFRVKKVNEVKPKSLKHLCELIEGCCTEDLVLELEHGKIVVMDYEKGKNATSEILRRHNIPSAKSKNLIMNQ